MISKFNPQLPSVLSPKRIDQINNLAEQAFNTANYIPADDPSCMHDLIIETHAMKDILEEIVDAGSFCGFYQNINSAFEMLINERPEKASGIFETYQQLTGMLRVIEREKAVINQKWQEDAKLLDDINTLDSEDCERKKGGISCQ